MKNLRLATAIKQLRYNEFIQLYLQLMKLTEQYVATTKNEVLLFVFEKMQKEIQYVKQLEVKLNTKSDTVKKRNRIHQNIKDSFGYLKGMVKANRLHYIQSHRNHAEYISDKIGKLLLLKNISTIKATLSTIPKIRTAIEQDSMLFNALLEVDLMEAIGTLFKQGEEFEQLDLQKNIEELNESVIDKQAIRKEANKTIILLFNVISLWHYRTKDAVWTEMAEEITQIVHPVE